MILVTGATGTVGREVVRQLAAEGLPVRALVHNPDRAGELTGPRIEVVAADLEKPQTLDRAFEGVERVFLVSPAAEGLPEREGHAIDAARRAGARSIVKISVGGGPDAATQIGRWHWSVEKQIESSGVPSTILRPNLFMQGSFFWLPRIAAENAFHLPMGDARVSVVDARDVAAVAVCALTLGGLPQRLYDLSGPEAISFETIGAEISRAAGRPVSYVDVTPRQWKKEAVESGVPAWLADDLSILYGALREGYGATVSTAVRDITGKAPRTFRDFATDHAARFRDAR